MWTDKLLPAFPRIVVVPSSGLKNPNRPLSCLTLKTKAFCQSSAAALQSILRNIPEDLNLRQYWRQTFEFWSFNFQCFINQTTSLNFWTADPTSDLNAVKFTGIKHRYDMLLHCFVLEYDHTISMSFIFLSLVLLPYTVLMSVKLLIT